MWESNFGRLTPSTRCRPRNCITQVKKRQYAGRRQKRLHDPATWSNMSHIMLLRQRALARVFGGVHPTTMGIEEALGESRDALRARETSPSPSESS